MNFHYWIGFDHVLGSGTLMRRNSSEGHAFDDRASAIEWLHVEAAKEEPAIHLTLFCRSAILEETKGTFGVLA